jgi:hypothetical protein
MAKPPNVHELPLIERAEIAMRKAFAQAVLDHYRAGEPLVLWRDGKVVHVPPEEFIDSAREILAQPLPTAPKKDAG